ncbi:WD repeat-containing protein CG11141 isoform X2 [Rhynchophorus ferrugineus]|uniref:WD repeat-containing protein CG11141 isoform X2 n=1 Tax=Rhynchophorus ferrugineus TaxID=354439 RepID=UPI003FCC3FB2
MVNVNKLWQDMANFQIYSLREWAPMTELLNLLPTKTSQIFSQDIKLSCIDILPDFLALGTNVGIVYWYDRKRKILQRLRCEDSNISLTFVKIVSTVEYMIACGNRDGNITIFQIPKTHPDTLPESLKPKQKQVERYTVTELHKSPITAIEWSKNGMKLFSGDKNGCVVLTEIDFYLHICKSIEILNESYEVVQLNYRQQRLLVSTTFRSIICHQVDKWKVCQVGKKDRKMLGDFGGLIHQNGYKPTDLLLFCTRPGLRIWISDLEGNVQKTLLFKDLLTKECPQVPLLNPISKELQKLKPQLEPSFGKLLPFCNDLLVTYNKEIVYILDPEQMSILATVSHLRNILDLSTYNDEIFILEEDRSLVRIAFHPECEKNCYDMGSPYPRLLPAQINLQDVKNDPIMNAEEAQESPREIVKTFDEISQQQFEENILFKQTKKNKRRSNQNDRAQSIVSQSSNSSEERDHNFIKPTLMNLSTVGILPDLRSPESIINDIEYKEKILADVLSLDKIKITEQGIHNSCPNQSKEIIPTEKYDNLIIPSSFDSDIGNQRLKKQTRNAPTVLRNSSDEESVTNKPLIKSIPGDWNLSRVELNNIGHANRLPNPEPYTSERKLSVTDSSLSDWEIV